MKRLITGVLTAIELADYTPFKTIIKRSYISGKFRRFSCIKILITGGLTPIELGNNTKVSSSNFVYSVLDKNQSLDV